FCLPPGESRSDAATGVALGDLSGAASQRESVIDSAAQCGASGRDGGCCGGELQEVSLTSRLNRLHALCELAQLLHFIFSEISILDIAEQAHNLRLVVEKICHLRVGRRRQTKEHIRVGRKHPGQLFDHLWPWGALFATLYPTQVGRGYALLGRGLTQAQILSNPEVANGFTKVLHGKQNTLLFSVMQHLTCLAYHGIIWYLFAFCRM